MMYFSLNTVINAFTRQTCFRTFSLPYTHYTPQILIYSFLPTDSNTTGFGTAMTPFWITSKDFSNASSVT